MVGRILAGESVLSVAEETPVPEQTFHRWKHLARVDQGLVERVNSTESAESRAANKLITALEKEFLLFKNASERFDAQAVLAPNSG